jgi:cytochrome c-type biogenesis protein CcmH/NrfF
VEPPSGFESVALWALSFASVIAALVVVLLWLRNNRRR